jgi:hypothetical protein
MGIYGAPLGKSLRIVNIRREYLVRVNWSLLYLQSQLQKLVDKAIGRVNHDRLAAKD